MTTTDKTLLWLRCENRDEEARSPLTPTDAGRLVSAGFTVVVERSSQRCFGDEAYLAMGCRIALPGQWREAPANAFILGLRELPPPPVALRHRHIYFARADKDQPGAADLLARLRHGGGELLDLEYLVDERERRLAAFGYWAGFAGAALAIRAWARQSLAIEPCLPPLAPYHSRADLLGALEPELERALERAAPPRSLVIGSAGRCGSGARALLEALQLPCDGWDIDETVGGGPFDTILAQDILVNCVRLQRATPPFLTPGLLRRPRRALRVIVDVSCDPGNPRNPLPVYREATSFAAPALRLRVPAPLLHLIAIDNLSSLLPAEASTDFSAQLLPALLQLANDRASVWRRARALLREYADPVPI
ncbi:saccharopine dehydrogenase [Parahaliea mediterranea]|uniref:Saccharopine dehydrogenase [NAD(+), L-lysine-forming] n=1 Tax=Parahaliea mediterranea TaxID=651086 RepID=A0A939INI3_9GAMM|nr:saccharopine dehydrogenase [Parahaliea mediterranea]MBN7798153.1 saccharopine dehydrogenase [Parahaliea mediterranea]